MLSVFPQILFLAPLGTTLLRIVAGLYFLYVAYALVADREAIEAVRLPVIGNAREWMVYLSSLVTFGVSILLIVGLWTQIAALLGALIALKHAVMARRYGDVLPLSSGTSLLLLLVCLTLVVMGAGLFAFDLPL